MNMATRRVILVSLALAAVVATVAMLRPFGGDGDAPSLIRGDDLVTLVAAPETYQDFVDVDLVAIGRIGYIAREGSEGPYNEADLLIDTRDVPKPRLYFTYYEIQIEKILLDDDNRIADIPILLRINGRVGEEQANFMPMPTEGMRALFAVHQNPDRLSYGGGPWRIISLDRETPRFLDWDDTPLDFEAGDDIQTFV